MQRHTQLPIQVMEAGAMVQSPTTTQFGAMVESAIATGIVDQILSPEDLSDAVHDIINLSADSEGLSNHLSAEMPPHQLNRILTHLPNRSLFLEQLKLFLRRAQREQAAPFAVLYLDIDDFTEINDTLGHLTGDVFLLEAAQRLQSCLRPGDVVARLGGDEFAMLLEAADQETALMVAERIQTAFTAPFTPRGQRLDAAASIGIALYTPDIIQAEDTALLENADIAMYRAKGRGPGRIEVFEPRMRSQDMARVELKTSLKAALSQRQFVLYYQPIVELHNHCLQVLQNHPI